MFFSFSKDANEKFNTSRKFKSLQFSCVFPNQWGFYSPKLTFTVVFSFTETQSHGVTVGPNHPSCMNVSQ